MTMRVDTLWLVAALSVVVMVAGNCDYCALRNNHSLDWAIPFEAGKEYPGCQAWQDNACCSYDTVVKIVDGHLYGPEYSVDRCKAVGKPLSDACKEFFTLEACFYECDPNAGKYRRHKDCDADAMRWVMHNMPIKASFCNDWYQACKYDYIPTCGTDGLPCDSAKDLLEGSAISIGAVPEADEFTCSKSFEDIFGSYDNPAAAFCEKVFDNAFSYEEHEEDAYTMNITLGSANPNDFVNHHIPIAADDCGGPRPHRRECPGVQRPQEVSPVGCHVCQVRNNYTGLDLGITTKVLATAEVDDLGVCEKYSNNSCCSASVAQHIPHGLLYGESYYWDRCDAVLDRNMSDSCRHWFRMESCFYECDVNVGKYRRYDSCVDPSGDDNQWEIFRLPLKASECDEWYEDCKDDFFCVCMGEDCPGGASPRNYFSLPELGCSEDNCRTFGEIYANGSELCEVMWGEAFKYETIETDAYSMDWAPEQTGGLNPNSFVNPGLPFTPNCPGFDGSSFGCPEEVPPEIDVDIVENIIGGDVNATESEVITQEVIEAEAQTRDALATLG